jgi:hypothetical protein
LLVVAVQNIGLIGELDGVPCPASSLAGMPSAGSYARLQCRDRGGILGGR